MSSVDLPKRKSATKTQQLRTILIAIPSSVEFRNYESNRLYQKAVSLQNVSTSLARFQLVTRPGDSRFLVAIESRGQRSGIPPGMRVKLTISFRCDVLDEPEEALMVNVQHGRPVIIKLRGYRDPPILRVLDISHLRYPQEESHATARNARSVVEAPVERMYSCKESIGTSSDTSSTDSSPHRGKLRSFDCGTCLVGEQVTLSLMVKNIGGEGRFFVMSEIDWCSMRIEDVTDQNALILTSFAMWPAYFTLKPQEYAHLYFHFFPDTRGTHVETLYAVCDNCSVTTMEMIGDGVACE